jgi:eukaryotic-like serine/threonine-protein kinase
MRISRSGVALSCEGGRDPRGAPDVNEQTLFAEALERVDPQERAAFLDQACQGDPALRARIERLLAQHEHAGGFLESSPVPRAATIDEPATERPGTVIGPYKLLERIGEGGMGTVWMAQQTEPVKRLVAVKLIKAGMDSRQVIARFEAERQALALMDHANIARVLDAGTTGAGRPYFVMDLVKGVPITRYCDEHHLTPRQRLELFLPVCQAIQHAHQKGIIHRDLKPSNVLVALYDGKPVPKVIDFGVAKAAGQALTDKTLVTGFGAVVGTLEYMSPEQAEVNQLDIDTRSDIYSLGVLLYELLAGSPPFTRKEMEKAGLLEMLRVIREQEPSKPSAKLSTAEGLPTLAANRGTEPAKLTKLVRGELDWIVMKALEKDRNRRYETANGFAMDVQRYLADEAVLACPPSVRYRLRKFVRRHKRPVLAATLVLLALVGGIIGTTIGLMRAEQARQDAVAAQEAEAGQRRTADEERAIAQAVNDFLQKDLLGQADLGNQPGGADDKLPRDPNIKVRTVLDRAARTIGARFAKQPRVEAAIRLTIAKAYTALGLYKEAQFHAEKSVTLRTAHLGADHADTLTSKDALVWVYLWQCSYNQADALNQEVLDKRTATLGADHLDTLSSKLTAAILHQQRNNLDSAEKLIREVIQKQEARLGSNDSATLWSKNNLASLHTSQGKSDLAAAEFIELIKTYESTFGGDYPGTLIPKTHLAGVYMQQGKYPQAEELFNEIVEKRLALQGEAHLHIHFTKILLGNLYVKWGKFDQGVAKLEEGLAGIKASLGEDSPSSLGVTYLLACTYLDAGKPERGRPLFEQLLARHEAKPLFDAGNVFNARYGLARTYLAEKIPGKAIPLLEEALTKVREQLGNDNPVTLAAMDFVAKGLLEAKQPEKALPIFREFLDHQRKRLGADSVSFANVQTPIGLELLKHKQFPDAERYLRECLAIREKKEPNAWTTFSTQSRLGEALLGQKKYADAEPQLLKGYEGMKQRKDQIPKLAMFRLTETLERLVQLYEAGNRPEEAAKWRKELADQTKAAGKTVRPDDE